MGITQEQKIELSPWLIYSNKSFHNFQLSETSFTCPGLHV